MIVGLLLRWEGLIGPGADDRGIGGCVVEVKAEVGTEIGVELEVVSEVERIGVERIVIPILASNLVFGGGGGGGGGGRASGEGGGEESISTGQCPLKDRVC
jgi:hypothetical protein